MSEIRFLSGQSRRVVALVVLAVALGSLLPALAADTYLRATVDGDGQLRIVMAGGQTVEPMKEKEQLGFAKPQVSPDGGAVGWLAEYANCCTSYPIPLKLMIYKNGSVRVFTGTGLPIWRWGFQGGGSQFAFQQETVHGGLGVHYELRDVATGRLLAEYDPAVGPDSRPLPSQNVPKWAAELDATR
jgi:hypothetical protein